MIENIKELSSIRLPTKRKVSGPIGSTKKKSSPLYKSPFVVIYNDTCIHSDVLVNLLSISRESDDKYFKIVMSFKDHDKVTLSFTKEELLNMYKKKKNSGENVLTDQEVINYMLIKISEHVRTKYKILVKSRCGGNGSKEDGGYEELDKLLNKALSDNNSGSGSDSESGSGSDSDD